MVESLSGSRFEFAPQCRVSAASGDEASSARSGGQKGGGDRKFVSSNSSQDDVLERASSRESKQETRENIEARVKLYAFLLKKKV